MIPKYVEQAVAFWRTYRREQLSFLLGIVFLRFFFLCLSRVKLKATDQFSIIRSNVIFEISSFCSHQRDFRRVQGFFSFMNIQLHQALRHVSVCPYEYFQRKAACMFSSWSQSVIMSFCLFFKFLSLSGHQLAYFSLLSFVCQQYTDVIKSTVSFF